MVEIIKTYRQQVPGLRFVGKKYGDGDRVDGMFGALWAKWFENGWFQCIQSQCKITEFEDSDAYIGLMRGKEGQPFEYWIGIFCSKDTEVPQGFEYIDYQPGDIGVAWLYGKEDSVYQEEDKCMESFKENGFKAVAGEDGVFSMFERYAAPRFTNPDEKGNIILDICLYIAGESM